jgi:hypothetical protein
MSFEGYLKTIKEKTGMTPDDFEKIARKKGLLDPPIKARPIQDWLKEDYDLGFGHAGAIYAIFRNKANPKGSTDERVDKYFSGAKADWRASFDKIVKKANTYGDDVTLDPAATYISLTRNKKKFAIVAATKDRLDVGIKRKGEPTTDRFAASGKWNSMVTHRAQLTDPKEINAELFKWLKAAYDAAG